jgi:hypothetical protein
MLQIGQIVFLISDSKTIEPIQVICRQSKEDFAGVHVEHVCSVIDSEGVQKSKIVLENSTTKYFISIDDAQEHLHKISSKIISNLAENARKKCLLFKQHVLVRPEEPKTADFSFQNQVETKKFEEIVLPDGTKARIHIPDELLT